MLVPGAFDLGSKNPIAAAVTDEVLTLGIGGRGETVPYLSGLGGALAWSLQCNFVYGSGGTTAILRVQTSLDGGASWLDAARFDFATANSRKIANLSGLTVGAVAEYAALSAEGKNDGLLGPLARAILTTTGTYAGATSIACRLVAR